MLSFQSSPLASISTEHRERALERETVKDALEKMGGKGAINYLVSSAWWRSWMDHVSLAHRDGKFLQLTPTAHA